MTEVRRAVTRAASAPFAVLIEGESGVGKELVARAIHCLSPRRERRFCDLNCAALPDELLESELFGHARGAFTGAITERAGLVEDADGGTLFLDEVADLSPRAQAKLLRVLQQQEVRRVGESFSRKVDVRIVSAVNRDMRAEAEAGRFRHDLLYRLDVIRIRVPPLRERPEDIPALAHHFWNDVAARVGTRAVAGARRRSPRYRATHGRATCASCRTSCRLWPWRHPAQGQVRPSLLPHVDLRGGGGRRRDTGRRACAVRAAVHRDGPGARGGEAGASGPRIGPVAAGAPQNHDATRRVGLTLTSLA